MPSLIHQRLVLTIETRFLNLFYLELGAGFLANRATLVESGTSVISYVGWSRNMKSIRYKLTQTQSTLDAVQTRLQALRFIKRKVNAEYKKIDLMPPY